LFSVVVENTAEKPSGGLINLEFHLQEKVNRLMGIQLKIKQNYELLLGPMGH